MRTSSNPTLEVRAQRAPNPGLHPMRGGGEGEPWKPVLRRSNTEAEARKIFAQAENALDHE